VRARQYVAQR